MIVTFYYEEKLNISFNPIVVSIFLSITVSNYFINLFGVSIDNVIIIYSFLEEIKD